MIVWVKQDWIGLIKLWFTGRGGPSFIHLLGIGNCKQGKIIGTIDEVMHSNAQSNYHVEVE
jgi:hypothetical protein